jgi:hypothetical protein
MSTQIVPFKAEDDILAQLAAEFGIQAEPEPEHNSSRVYTNLTTLENIRVLNAKSWQDGKTFQWNIPGNPEMTEEIEELANTVHQIGGFIVHSEVHSALSIKNDNADNGRATKTVCSTVGYKKGSDYVKELPEKVYFNTMYGGWDKDAGRPIHTQPNSYLEGMGLLGSRGMSCLDCIKSGQSAVYDEATDEVLGECSLKGRIFVYVTHLTRFKSSVPKGGKEPEVTTITKSVEELMGEPGFILMINLPNKVALKGFWDKNDESKRRQGYLSYLMSLKIKYGKANAPKTSPRLTYTSLAIKPPVEGTKNTKNFLVFEEVETFDYNLMKSGLVNWVALRPKPKIEILDPSSYVINGKGGPTVYADAIIDKPSLKAAYEHVEAEEIEDDDDDDSVFG